MTFFGLIMGLSSIGGVFNLLTFFSLLGEDLGVI